MAEDIEYEVPEMEEAVALEDGEENDSDALGLIPLAQYVQKQFTRAEDYRYNDEQRWLKAYRNYRGIYGPDVQFTSTEKSRVFIKVTKTKVLAAYSQIIDVLFANNKFPISIDPTVLPEGVADTVHFDPNAPAEGEDALESPYGFAGDGEELPKGATVYTLKERLGALKRKLTGINNLKEGPGTTPTAVTLHPAMVTAKKHEKKIHDQLEESHASQHLRSAAFELSLFGSGVIKGPFAEVKEYAKWVDGEYAPVIKDVPKVEYVSLWDFYPDPDAKCMSEAEYTVQRYKMSRTQMRALKKRPYFRKSAIERVLAAAPNYTKKYWEDNLIDYSNEQEINRYEVLEYWGIVDVRMLKEQGVELPDEVSDLDEVQVNVWICGGELLRVVMNPFKPVRIPYACAPFEHNPYSIFGIGVAENMEDTQIIMNGFMRMAIDNAALSGNLLIEIDETNLTPGQDLEVYPGKVFRRQAGAPGQAIFGTKFPNVSSENMMMFDKARQLADESTGIPSFSHGQTGVTGVGRTAAGISMLMGAASGSAKNVIKNIDDYLLKPVGEGLFYFNMQFDQDESIKGDLEVKARGTESLMANEVRSQRLMQFLGVVSNPALAPFAKMDYMIREIAKSMELDPDKVTNNMADAAIQAEMLKGMQAPAGTPTGGPAGGPPSPADMSGGGNGNIGVGAAALPMEQGFSGNEGTQAAPAPAQAAG